jgi:hypothetical protein
MYYFIYTAVGTVGRESIFVDLYLSMQLVHIAT